MICVDCRRQVHNQCRGGTWCDCAHQTEGKYINRQLVDKPESDVVPSDLQPVDC